VCVSKGQCTGQALLCDDGNPCTADRCDRAGGCIHNGLDRIACPAGGACVPGATCAQGVCTDSIREGWVRTLAVPGNAYPFSAAAHPDGGHVLLVNRQVGLRLVPHLVRVDAAGSLVSDIPLDLLKSTEGRGLAVRPDGTAIVLAFDYPDTAVLAVDLGAVSHAGMAKIRPAGDGWAMLLGVLDSAPQGDLTDIAFVRVDGAGKVVVQRTFHEDGNDFVIGFVGLPDGAFVATGNRILYLGEGKGDVGWMRRIEADGAPGWSVVRENVAYGAAAWDGTSVVVLGAGILRVTADGQVGIDEPIGAHLPGGASEILPDALGLVLAGTSSGSADRSMPWLARLFAPCVTGTCDRPGCP
jgi:hypothetical protein